LTVVKRKVTEEVVEEAPLQPRDEVEGWVVRYVGTSNLRKITRADWEKAGVDHGEIAWYRDAPGNAVPLRKFKMSAEDFDRCVLADPEFKLEELQH
jgi:hypothetical protein